MNKKLIAVALAALPVAAMADVTLYGTIKGGLESSSVTDGASQSKVQDYTSLIGFKGNEDLGNGLKAIWQVENRVHLDGTGSDGFASRQTFVGVDGGDLGTVRIGYLNNTLNDNYAVDQWSYSNRIFDATSVSGANGLAVFANSGDRLKNAVRYDSATFAGFSGSLVFGMGENTSKTNNDNRHASNIGGVGLNYTYGDVAAHYAYQVEMNPNQPGNTSSVTYGNNDGRKASKQLFEVDYSANNLFLSAAYQVSTGYDWTDDFAGDGINGYNPVASQIKARQAAVSVAYTIGAFTPKFSYAKGWNLKSGDVTVEDTGYTQYVMGVDYALSKRTTAGLAYGSLKFDKGNAFAQTFSAGKDVTLKTVALTLAHSF